MIKAINLGSIITICTLETGGLTPIIMTT